MSDVLNWIVAVGTVAAFMVAFWQIRTERQTRKLLEKTQAEQQVRCVCNLSHRNEKLRSKQPAMP